MNLVLTALAAVAVGGPPAGLWTREKGVDWPGFLGPNRDGVSTETGIRKEFPLKSVWSCEAGDGYAAPAVAGGRAFVLGRFGDRCRVSCRNAETGAELWRFEYPTDYEDFYGYNGGPRCSAVVDGGRVYVHGVEGMLFCLSVTDGSKVWAVDTLKKYHFHQNFFGVGGTPVVDGGLLIAAVGGSPKGPRPSDLRDAKGDGTGLVAFDKKTGKEVWRSSDELASYSSPTVVTIDGERWGFYFARGGLVAFAPKTGEVKFHLPWRARVLESVNASNPVIVKDEVLISECYKPGSVLLKVGGGRPKAVWSDEGKGRDKSLLCHWNTPIYHKGYVYGCSGRDSSTAKLRCVEWKTGKVMWERRGLYRCSLTKVDGHFVCLSEDGRLILIQINPKKFERVASAETGLKYPAWAAPVLSHGLLYLRGKERLLCLELIPAGR